MSLSSSRCFCLLSLSLSLSVYVCLCLCVSLSLSPCCVVCVVCVVCGVCGVCGVWCVWCVWCGVGLARRKNLRVQVQNVPVCTSTTRTCGNTCARGAGTHGDVLNLHTEVFGTDTRRVITCCREVHRKKPLVLTHSRFENRSRTTRSRVLQSFALPDEAVELHFYREGTTHTYAPTHTHQPTHPWTHPPPLPSPPSPLPPTRTRTRKRTCTCTCICVCVSVSVCVSVGVCVSVNVRVRVSVSVSVGVGVGVGVCARVYVYDLPQWFHVFLLYLLHIYIYILHIYVYTCVIMTRGSHNIRNGIAWAQPGHGTFT